MPDDFCILRGYGGVLLSKGYSPAQKLFCNWGVKLHNIKFYKAQSLSWRKVFKPVDYGCGVSPLHQSGRASDLSIDSFQDFLTDYANFTFRRINQSTRRLTSESRFVIFECDIRLPPCTHFYPLSNTQLGSNNTGLLVDAVLCIIAADLVVLSEVVSKKLAIFILGHEIHVCSLISWH